MEKIKKRDPRKIWLVLPLLMMPFMALAFYALGGGREQQNAVKQKGINMALPRASFKNEDPKGKLEIYDQQQRDSSGSHNGISDIAEKLGFQESANDQQTREIEEKLSLLNQEITKPQPVNQTAAKPRSITVPGMKSDVDRLEGLMKNMQGNKGEDQEMKQLSGMLEKVLDIQHPERVRDAYLNQVNAAPEKSFAAIPAIVQSTQKLIQGAVLKLVLTDSVTINNVLIPKGHELFGLCNLTNQRLLVDIKTIRLGNNIIPVDLSVYSLDGIKGIPAPEAVVGNAVSGGADDAVRSLQLLTMDQSVGMQVAGAGIDAAKGLFSKKVRALKMKVKAGLPVLLRNNQMKLIKQ